VSGPAHQTIAAIRKRPTGHSDQLDARLGHDGRVRPRDSARRRDFASKVLADDPDTSLREIARAAAQGRPPKRLRREVQPTAYSVVILTAAAKHDRRVQGETGVVRFFDIQYEKELALPRVHNKKGQLSIMKHELPSPDGWHDEGM
jgi:hypothetical protein